MAWEHDQRYRRPDSDRVARGNAAYVRRLMRQRYPQLTADREFAIEFMVISHVVTEEREHAPV